MKKLVLHKNKLILLAVMFFIFTVMGLWTSSGTFELRGSSSYREYLDLVKEHSGALNPVQLAESRQIAEAARASHEAEYGKAENDLFMMYLLRNPVVKFHYDYANFGERVKEYWNGPEHQNKLNIKGVYPLEERLAALDRQQNSYEYKYYQKRLKAELSHGEPVFAHTQFWNNYASAFDISRIVFMFLMTLAFVIAPVFTQEIKTDMNSIVLCSIKGRREIVTAKLLAVCTTAVMISALYFGGYFLGALAATGNIDGFGAPARCFATFEAATIDTTVAGMALIGILWTTLAAGVFALFVCLISAYAKNQTSVFGLSVVFILTFSMIGFTPDYIHATIWPLVDFNFITLSLYSMIFNGGTMYNLFGTPVSYGMAAFMTCIALSAIIVLLTYIAQKRRSVT